MGKIKEFDCVEMKRKIQDRIFKEEQEGIRSSRDVDALSLPEDLKVFMSRVKRSLSRDKLEVS